MVTKFTTSNIVYRENFASWMEKGKAGEGWKNFKIYTWLRWVKLFSSVQEAKKRQPKKSNRSIRERTLNSYILLYKMRMILVTYKSIILVTYLLQHLLLSPLSLLHRNKGLSYWHLLLLLLISRSLVNLFKVTLSHCNTNFLDNNFRMSL